MYTKKYKQSQILMIAGFVLLAINTVGAHVESNHMLSITIPLRAHMIFVAVSLLLCCAGFILYATLLWFVWQFTDVTKRSVWFLLIAHVATIVSLLFLQLNAILSARLPFASLFFISLVYRHFSGVFSIDRSLRNLCAEIDNRLLFIGVAEQKKREEEIDEIRI